MSRPVGVSITGGAQQFTDYAINGPGLINFSGSFGVDIPVGQTSVTVTVTPEFQPASEGAETVVFTVEGSSATATIVDEPVATITATDASAAELGNNTATFVISRAAGASTAYVRPVGVSIDGWGTAVHRLCDQRAGADQLQRQLWRRHPGGADVGDGDGDARFSSRRQKARRR